MMLYKQTLTRLITLFMFIIVALPGCGGGGSGGNNPPPSPAVTTMAATGITVHSAILYGTVNPLAQATNAWLEWGTDNTLSTPTIIPAQAIGAGTTDQLVSATITNLTVGTTYYYRVAAMNASGTQKGAIASFTTALPNSPPAVTTNAATSVTISGAVLNGTVSPNELATTAVFEWGTDPNLSIPALTPVQSRGGGTTSVAINDSLSGLIPGTTYYFRVVATNSAGTLKGLIAGFSTVAQPPTVSTAAPTSITTSGATLNGSVNPNGLAVNDAHFEYGTDPALVSPSTTPTQTMGSGFTGQSINATVSLAAGTTYYFRVVAINSAGTSTGMIVSFSTDAQSQAVTTGAATSISTTGASLNGTVNPNGLAVNDAHFEYGTSPTLATSTTTYNQSLGSGFTDQPISASLVGLLTAGTTYYYRVTAGTSTGTIRSFTTHSSGGTFTYNSSGQNAKVTTGVSNAVIFSHYLPFQAIINYSGVFSIDFSPTAEYGIGGSISIRLLDSYDTVTYFQLSTKDASVTKVRKGVVVDSAAFPFSYSQGNTYPIKITFSPLVATFEAFGGTVSLTFNTSANPIIFFEVETTQQDAFYDNIKLETGSPLSTIFSDDFSTDTTGNYTVY